MSGRQNDYRIMAFVWLGVAIFVNVNGMGWGPTMTCVGFGLAHSAVGRIIEAIKERSK